MLRYSLGTLFVLVAVVALGCTAWMNFSEIWVQVMVASVWLAISTALLVGLLSRGPSRVFATGFAAVGGTYFLLAFAMDRRDERLITERPVDWIYKMQQKPKTGASPRSAAEEVVAVDEISSRSSESMTAITLKLRDIKRVSLVPRSHPAPRELQDIGHCFWTLLLAAIGGVLAQVVHRRRTS